MNGTCFVVARSVSLVEVVRPPLHEKICLGIERRTVVLLETVARDLLSMIVIIYFFSVFFVE
jgi:hypothetical protein